MVAMGVVLRDAAEDALVLGELALDCVIEAAWAEGLLIIAPP